MRFFNLLILLFSFHLANAQLSPITNVTLEFTSTDGTTITASATDIGNGLEIDNPINLQESTDYSLAITLNNGGSDITSEVTDNANNLQFFFETTEGQFEGTVLYADSDNNGLPLGLATNLTTGCVEEISLSGSFRVWLNSFPDTKPEGAVVSDGVNVFDLSWLVNIANDADAPDCENEEEVIDRVTLTFTPANGDAPVVAIASDPDGPGPLDLTVGDVALDESTEYELSITLENTIEGEDITEEIAEEDEDHLFLFAFGEELFESPDGDGNVDNRADPINYNDQDSNGLPVGLSTNWTTACTAEGDVTGTFRVVLKHQPGVKSATSGIDDGGTDVDITWNVTVIDDVDAPECENEEEVIDRVTLTFTPANGGAPVVAIASDPDGPGPLDLTVGDVALDESTEYELSITLENTIEGEDITEEIAEEDEDHLFLFAFGEELFESPDGDGNVDNRADPINYNDQDSNGLPVGLSTNWTTACTSEGNVSGAFRVVLKHQPGVKSATSGFEDGGTDVDITWNVTVIDDVDAPECENEEEVIDRVTLTFTPVDGGTTIVAEATDPDGPGPQDLVVEDINLAQDKTYEMSISLENTMEGEDITEEIQEEAEEHQFFFGWTGDVFTDPTGDGNIDNQADPVNYNDQDSNGLPLGLSTNWTVGAEGGSGTLRIVLKHQPDIKSATTSVNDGGTDIDITWNINTILTSTDDLDRNQSLVIAPNPVRQEIRLLTENLNLQNSEVIIYNTLGIVVKTLRTSDPILPVQDLVTGHYFLSIKGESWSAVRRFTKINN